MSHRQAWSYLHFFEIAAEEYYNNLTEELILNRIEAEMGMQAEDCAEMLAKLVETIKIQ